MNRDEMREKILGLLQTHFEMKHIDQLEDSMRLNADLRIDSIMLVQLIVYIEMELHIEMPEDEMDPRVFSTVGSLLDFLEALQPA